MQKHASGDIPHALKGVLEAFVDDAGPTRLLRWLAGYCRRYAATLRALEKRGQGAVEARRRELEGCDRVIRGAVAFLENLT